MLSRCSCLSRSSFSRKKVAWLWYIRLKSLFSLLTICRSRCSTTCGSSRCIRLICSFSVCSSLSRSLNDFFNSRFSVIACWTKGMSSAGIPSKRKFTRMQAAVFSRRLLLDAVVVVVAATGVCSSLSFSFSPSLSRWSCWIVSSKLALSFLNMSVIRSKLSMRIRFFSCWSLICFNSSMTQSYFVFNN